MKQIEITTWVQLLVFLVILIAILFILAVFDLWLWKVIAVAIFGLPTLTFWQLVGLKLLVCSIFHGSLLSNMFSIKTKEGE